MTIRRDLLGIKLLLLLGLLNSTLGCAGTPGSQPAVAPGTVVVRVGDDVVTAASIEARLGEAGQTGEPARRKQDILDSMVRTDLLAQEARRRGLENTPSVQAAIRRALADELVRTVSEAATHSDPTDSEIQAYLDENRATLDRPERIRVRHLLLACIGADQTGATQCNATGDRARALLAQMRANEAFAHAAGADGARYNPGLVGQLIAANSDDVASKPSGGDFGFLTREEAAARFPQKAVEAAFALQQAGELTDVIAGPAGFHILSLRYREPSRHADLATPGLREMMKFRVTTARGQKAVTDLVAELRKSTPVHVDEKVLAAIQPPQPKLIPATATLPPALRGTPANETAPKEQK